MFILIQQFLNLIGQAATVPVHFFSCLWCDSLIGGESYCRIIDNLFHQNFAVEYKYFIFLMTSSKAYTIN